MSRKDDSKAKDVVSVNVEEFSRSRDSIIVSLSQLQSAVSDLTRAYINHANTVLNRGPTTFDTNVGSITSDITAHLLENGLLTAPRATSPGVKSDLGDKKKRKRPPPDPHAPKRALTPFFLYMQHNRARIAEEMGADAKPKDVADEGTRRWQEMPEAQKEVWKKLYADNLAVYREKMKAYKASLPVPEDDNARAESQLQQDVAEAQESGEESDEEDEGHESSPELPEPVREPTPPRSTKRRRSDLPKTSKEVASPPSTRQDSPEKRKRSGKKDKGKDRVEELAAASRKLSASESKRAKKKRRSEVAAEE